MASRVKAEENKLKAAAKPAVQIGDEITIDGQKGYVAGIDENGQPTSISHSADNLRVEREQQAAWVRDYKVQDYIRNVELSSGTNYSHSFGSDIAMNLNPIYGQPDGMQTRGFMGRQLDSFSQWRKGVFNSYEDLAISSGGGFGTAAVAFLETPTRLGLGVLEGGLTLGGLVFDSSVRQDTWDGLNYLYDNYDTVIPKAVNNWMDQSWNEQLADAFVFGGESLLGGTAGKLSYDGIKYSAQWSKMKFNYDYRHYFTGTQVLDSDQVFYSFKNSNYFDPNSSFEPMDLWMTPELMTPDVAISKLALPFDSGYDTIMKITLPQGTQIMNPRPVWSLFGKPGGGIETRSYNHVTNDMYKTYSVDELFRGGN